MNTKMPAPIEKLTLNAATFHGVEVVPTLINFFYGNNGTEKTAIFSYSTEIRKVICTTNTIESLNMSLRKLTRNRRIFPNDESALKIVALGISEASKKWTSQRQRGQTYTIDIIVYSTKNRF